MKEFTASELNTVAGVAIDLLPGRSPLVVGGQQGRLLVAPIDDGDLAQLAGEAVQPNLDLLHAGRAADAAEVGESHLTPSRGPSRGGSRQQGGAPFAGAPAPGEEADAQPVQRGEVGLGDEAGVKHQLGGQLPGAGQLLAGEQSVVVEAGQVGGQQEETAVVGSQLEVGEVEAAVVEDGSGPRAVASWERVRRRSLGKPKRRRTRATVAGLTGRSSSQERIWAISWADRLRWARRATSCRRRNRAR